MGKVKIDMKAKVTAIGTLAFPSQALGGSELTRE
jgi:hypothetical protein